MLGLPDGKVIVVPYNPMWSKLFDEEPQLIREAIGPIVKDVQHVGNTSIPDIDAKPILDIGVALFRFEDGERCVEPLVKLGWVYRGLSESLHRHRYFVRNNPRTHQLHMVESTNEEWINLVVFRDYLISHADVAREYAALKRSLVAKFQDGREYANAKAPFIKVVLAQAKQEYGYRRPSLET